MSCDTDTDADAPAPPKYSRYRSVRQAAKDTATTTAPTAPEQNDAVKRSMSRYRRQKTVPKQEQPADQPLLPAVPTISTAPRAHPATYASLTGSGEPAPVEKSHAATRHTSDQRRLRASETEHAREDQQQTQQQREEEEQRRVRQAADEKLAEQKRKDLERLEATLDAAVQSAPPRVASPVKEKFSFFSRKRTQKTSAAPARLSAVSTPSRGSSDAQVKGSEGPLRTIEHGGGGAAPGADAPISAVNYGERRVLVRFKQSSINLPITPETTPVDIIRYAAKVMSHHISPAATILLESYTQLGLERRVRRYEHIRDIMNSWDRDTQNAFFLQGSDTPMFDTDLETSSVPREAPTDVTVYMYHSQKAGKWNKCHITLLSSGQVFMAKKPGAKLSDKDSMITESLSDFDIYTPTPAQNRKLKPPKKHCYAVKSQQKTTMFLSTENFVHFFSAEDEALADKWYTAVQRWRSWYLVHRMGVGEKRAKKSTGSATTITRTSTKATSQKPKPSATEESPYQIGSFQPLFETGADHLTSENPPEAEARQIPFHLRNSQPPTTSRRHPPPVSYRLPPDTDEFASSSLLGRTYSQRVRAQKDHHQQLSSASGFTDGPSLLNDRSLSQRSKRPDASVSSTGTGTGPKPLLDFTPQFKEAPQWERAGRGRAVAPREGVPLVQMATTPETGGVALPRTTVLTRDAVAGTGVMDRGRWG